MLTSAKRSSGGDIVDSSNIDKELEEILKTNNGEDWQTRSIKVLALAIYDLRRSVWWLRWLVTSVIVLLVVNLITG